MSDFTVPASGDVIAGRYSVEGVIGTGGMGVVLAAVHAELGHHVAIKVLRQRSSASVERFRREARVVAKLQSEHVARVTDFGQLDDGSPFVVMDLLEGRDLEEELRDRGPLPITEAVDHVLSACEALAEAHASGIVHRDIKPKNLFLARGVGGKTVLKVLDFGLAKVDPLAGASVTRTEDIFGSPAYMAPEQMKSARDVDARADIWALGVTLFELLAGKPPFDAGSVPETCALVLREPAPSIRIARPDVGGVLARVIERCLEKDPNARFSSILSLVQRLETFGSPQHEGLAKRVEAIAAMPRSERLRPITTSLTPMTPKRVELPTLPSTESQELSVEVKTTGGQSGGPLSTTAPSPRSRALVLTVAAVLAAAVAAGFVAVNRRAAAPVASLGATPTSAPPPVAPVAPSAIVSAAPATSTATTTSPELADAGAAPAPSAAASIPRVLRPAPAKKKR